MAAIIFSALVMCAVSLFIGQAALRLAGAQEWNWLAPAVGLSIAMLLATPTVHLPGRSATMAVLLAVLTIAAAIWCLRTPQHRPPLLDLAAALPVAFLVFVPFLAAGRGGILGVTVNNDMSVHLSFVEGFISSAVPLPADYPLGPHALAAALSKGLGIEADLAFSGWTMAIPVISAWTVLAAARHTRWFGMAVAATVTSMPFLIAAYYGQGSFKEVAQAGLVLAVVLFLSGCGPRLGRGRWVPFALLIGGIVSAYSPAGLAWVVAISAFWLAGLLAIQAQRRGLREVPGIVRAELPAVGVGVGVLVVILLPQAQRLWEFVSLREGTGIAVNDIGNLIANLPVWEAQGIWDSVDYRLPASPAFTGGRWSWFVVALILFGSFWAFRRGRWLLPLSAAAAILIWQYADRSQSIYVAAKALMIASPLLLLLTVLPVLDREQQHWPQRPRWVWLVAPTLVVVLFLRVAHDDFQALRFSPVGPTDHARQLMSFRAPLAGKSALVLGGDEFLIWELAGVEFRAATLVSVPQVPMRPQKEWGSGEAIDFDTVPASTLNEYEWVIAPRDPSASAPPPQLHLVRSTESFQLWKRTGRVKERSILKEGQWPGAFLQCNTDEGREIVAGRGVAGIRRAPILATGGRARAGKTLSIPLRLPPGHWQLVAPYTSGFPLQVEAPGLSTVLPPILDRLGPRWPIGHVTVHRQHSFLISFAPQETPLASRTATLIVPYILVIPAQQTDRIVPISRACGRYVDWYRQAG